MRKYYIFIILLGILVFGLIVAGFIEVGTPLDKRAIAADNKRLSSFSAISYLINDYYYAKSKLPNSLSELKISGSYSTSDPETKKTYDYKKISDTSYNLCTTFSTDSEEAAKKNRSVRAYDYSDDYDYSDKKHKKGYDCIEYKVEDYGYEDYDARTPSPAVIDNTIKSISPNALSSLEVNKLNITLSNVYLSATYYGSYLDGGYLDDHYNYLFLELNVKNIGDEDHVVSGNDFVRLDNGGLLSAPFDEYGGDALKKTDIKVYSVFKVKSSDNSFKILFGDLNNSQAINLDFTKAATISGYLYLGSGFSETKKLENNY